MGIASGKLVQMTTSPFWKNLPSTPPCKEAPHVECIECLLTVKTTDRSKALREGTKSLKEILILYKFLNVQKKLSKEQEAQNYQADLEKKIELKMKKQLKLKVQLKCITCKV